MLKSVTRIRLVKTENPSVCVTVNCKVCRSVIALQLSVVPSVYKVSINPIKTPSNIHTPEGMTVPCLDDPTEGEFCVNEYPADI
jgi:hypothetical protein